MNTPTSSGREPPSFGIGQLLFVVVLAVIFFLLSQSMLRHHFHEGGRDHPEQLHRAIAGTEKVLLVA